MGRTATRLLAVFAVIVTVFGLRPAQASDDAATVMALTNELRAQHGLDPLATAADLDAVATRYAGVLAETGTLAHNPQLAREVDNWQTVGENVGVGPDVKTIHDALVRSAPHLANLLNESFTELGLGVVAKDGRIWLVQVFRRPMVTAAAAAPPAPAPAPAPAAAASTPVEPVSEPARAVETATAAEPAAPAPAHTAPATPVKAERAVPNASHATPTPAAAPEPAPAAAPATTFDPATTPTSVLVNYQPAEANVPAPISVAGTNNSAQPRVSPLVMLAGVAWLVVAGETLVRMRAGTAPDLLTLLNPAA